uniref:G-type lectin S-receptor-like serine/threonine-protein kinase At4g27290 n=1 Tax=Erigeron canadensis TaxID=72917 RepID=UPI001CB9C260|nr:G-type lectin S-receptor-like serine/threonine-protein kinase At4g27290 [Erigeron canadensis]
MVLNKEDMHIQFTHFSTLYALMFKLTPGGKINVSHLLMYNHKWIHDAISPNDKCDDYGLCGPYGICTSATPPYCECMKGFEKISTPNETSPGNWTSGCRISRPLNCGLRDGFRKYSSLKLPDTQNAVYNRSMSLQECQVACTNNCSCTAYANPNITAGALGCLLWFGDLIDVRVYQEIGQDLYVRMAASELLDLIGRPGRAFEINKKSSSMKENIELPLFTLSQISEATNKFDVKNKLGEGGFGPVYKGMLEGQEGAVKLLSASSRQGFDEFKNEVICIAKLQHRNLVKLLGYCNEDNGTILIYEYMPNKSLDTYIFDENLKPRLSWSQRFHIICGIARGLLYLHQDSQPTVVHRDLKAGNILLDLQMRPKISDFGLARMFDGQESEENTKRVVGTLGYISPEYAVNGVFSTKSDIFSFGVLVLEIVSGKKNRGFVDEDHNDNLLGHAWRLYNENKSLELVDTCLHKSYSVSEVVRSVHIGLLCVQHQAEDRPNAQFVVDMLDGEGSLPSPKKPGFFVQGSEIVSNSVLHSINGLTLSQIHGR